jgi:hypothetical protein
MKVDEHYLFQRRDRNNKSHKLDRTLLGSSPGEDILRILKLMMSEKNWSEHSFRRGKCGNKHHKPQHNLKSVLGLYYS